MKIILKYQDDIPLNWERFDAQKTTTVSIRECNTVDEFTVPWQDAKLISDPEKDLIVVLSDGSEYPCKINDFKDTYELNDYGKWYKKEICVLIKIPYGVVVEIHSPEGILPLVSYPDYIVIGEKGKLHVNDANFVENNLEFIE